MKIRFVSHWKDNHGIMLGWDIGGYGYKMRHYFEVTILNFGIKFTWVPLQNSNPKRTKKELNTITTHSKIDEKPNKAETTCFSQIT